MHEICRCELIKGSSVGRLVPVRAAQTGGSHFCYCFWRPPLQGCALSVPPRNDQRGGGPAGVEIGRRDRPEVLLVRAPQLGRLLLPEAKLIRRKGGVNEGR